MCVCVCGRDRERESERERVSVFERARKEQRRLSGDLTLEPGAALEAAQGQNDSFFSQLPYKCYLKEIASVGD